MVEHSNIEIKEILYKEYEKMYKRSSLALFGTRQVVIALYNQISYIFLTS
ncbi:hypothetical protein J18TS1_06900 [Oceanobacillus oncorhynchi subsp. incaldanensis]|uniref:Uncharacterized protein n=1 Tax=Oceanobacillus oncorhynchi TaxID=545501 RepID=A0A0A1MTW2_9BACI|nr:hypothetical protein J18TS1_06900 [Oceanobacillus oncorhynchi subsp. incaldanensis]CEI82972.1 hypothetical protein BN997_02861 [Oceanobacillus oncorhynchi]